MKDLPLNGYDGAPPRNPSLTPPDTPSAIQWDLLSADTEWQQSHNGGKHFGANIAETIPLFWSKNYLATKYTWCFAQHVLWCLHMTDMYHRPGFQLFRLSSKTYHPAQAP
eukprot:8258660-Ditylum_brightwellii.AAC.1